MIALIYYILVPYSICSIICIHVQILYLSSVSPRINERKKGEGGGDLAGAQSMKLYLRAWCMYTYSIHSLDVLRLTLSYF